MLEIGINIIDWTNNNAGFLALLLFIITIISTSVFGFCRFLRKKPVFKIRVIDKMTFYTIYSLGVKYKPPHLNEEFDMYKICFALYLEVKNLGLTPSSMGKISIGYYPYKIKRELFPKRNWIIQTNCLGDFCIPSKDGSSILINHLHQRSTLFPDKENDSYLKIGESIIGVGYFEQGGAWGNANPREEKDGLYDIEIKIEDMLGKTHIQKTKIKKLSLDDALIFNPKFGQTMELLSPNKG